MSRVLVVDDDPHTCELVVDILRHVGLATVCANSDEEAYQIISSPLPLKALVVDVNLGAGTTGFDVARFARQAFPTLPVIYVTGEATHESFLAFGVPDSVFIEKPFDLDELAEAVLKRVGGA